MKNSYVNGEFILGDCLVEMAKLADSSIDLVICDLPYGSTRNQWDIILPFDQLWSHYNRVVKPNGVVVLFGQDKFTAKVMLSNEKNHKYNWIWKKGERTSGFLNAKKMPLRNHEDIMVFYRKTPTYNPQMVDGKKANSRGTGALHTNNNYGAMVGNAGETPNGTLKYPKSILDFDRPHPPIHPTQKPVALFEYLIRTYSNEGDTVLDNCAGSATAGIAAMNTNRKFILIEKEQKYFEQFSQRLADHENN